VKEQLSHGIPQAWQQRHPGLQPGPGHDELRHRRAPRADAFAQLDAFVETGGNLVDTADVYNNGIAETTVGKWFASRPSDVTDHVVLATKGRTKTGDDVNEAECHAGTSAGR
jgi:aryl-alcohol dehydrogenase-like predicted oxidoreductase